MENKFTPLSELGEFGLIERISSYIKPINPSTITGIGDDAAVIDAGANYTLITTDMLLQGIHFDLVYTPLKHLGYKAVVVNVSDIYAMNGTPTQITVSLGLSSKFSVEMVEELYAGMLLACDEYGVDLIGGDTSASVTGLVISITCIGQVEKDKIAYRNGAKSTDLVCVSGDLGSAYMGLLLLDREKQVFKDEKEFNPDFTGFEYIIQRQLKPEARKDIVALLNEHNIIPTSMIDISDGLSSELLHICKQSQCGCRIYEDRIPIDYQTAKMAEEVNLNLTTAALNGGEDYELLFTVPLAEYDKIKSIDEIKVIGHITDAQMGCGIVTRDDKEFELTAQGWSSFTKEE